MVIHNISKRFFFPTRRLRFLCRRFLSARLFLKGFCADVFVLVTNSYCFSLHQKQSCNLPSYFPLQRGIRFHHRIQLHCDWYYPLLMLSAVGSHCTAIDIIRLSLDSIYYFPHYDLSISHVISPLRDGTVERYPAVERSTICPTVASPLRRKTVERYQAVERSTICRTVASFACYSLLRPAPTNAIFPPPCEDAKPPLSPPNFHYFLTPNTNA
jgi:hypothetical protein